MNKFNNTINAFRLRADIYRRLEGLRAWADLLYVNDIELDALYYVTGQMRRHKPLFKSESPLFFGIKQPLILFILLNFHLSVIEKHSAEALQKFKIGSKTKGNKVDIWENAILISNIIILRRVYSFKSLNS